jgi:hypothetical protein
MAKKRIIRSEEYIAKLRMRKLSDEAKRKISEANKNPSKETRMKMSLARKGKKFSLEARQRMSKAQSGENNPNYGKHRPQYVKDAISKAQKGHKTSLETRKKISDANKGEKNGAWKNGARKHKYCFLFNNDFRLHIRKKFGYTCYLCGAKEPENRNHSVHHIDYNKNSICNGKEWGFVLLCTSCNVKANTNRWYWFNLLINYWLEISDCVYNGGI